MPATQELRFLVDQTVFDEMPIEHVEVVRSLFAHPSMHLFCAMQEKKALTATSELDPNAAKSAEEFLQRAKDLRLLSRFWIDLRTFAESCGASRAT